MFQIKNMGLKVEQNLEKAEHWNLVCFCNSNYAGDPDTNYSDLVTSKCVWSTYLPAI